MECDNQQQLSQKDGVSEETAAKINIPSQQRLNDRSDLGPVEKKMKPYEFAEFDQLVDELSKELKIARHPDSSQVLKAARLLLETEGNRKDHSQKSSSLKEDTKADTRGRTSTTSDSNRTIQMSKFTLDDVPLPKTFNTKPKSETDSNENKKLIPSDTLERASKALKLLYLDDQRQLQNSVNELITAVQSITANPKTNSRLMATGR